MTYHNRGRDLTGQTAMPALPKAAGDLHKRKQDAIAEMELMNGPVGTLDFVVELIDQVQTLYKTNPDAEISLGVEGKWQASLIEVDATPSDQNRTIAG